VQANTARPVALVTGASAGIGAEFARALAARGYDLVLVARRRERLEELAGELAAAKGAHAEVLAVDLTDPAGLRQVEDRLRAGGIDLLVNNAGFGVPGFFWETDLDAQDKMHRLHVLATMRLAHAALGVMVPRGSGAIINVSSVAGFVQSATSSTYSGTKFWMNGFTYGLHLELRNLGSAVKVQALCPGFTLSEFHDVAKMDRNLIPGWLWLKAEDVVKASLAGLDRGSLFVVPGWIYKLIVYVVPALPRFLRDPVLIRGARKRGGSARTD
jgi:short-subunit dehydrogenase